MPGCLTQCQNLFLFSSEQSKALTNFLREPLKNIEPFDEKKYSAYDPIISDKINHMERFETGVPPPKEKFETKEQKKEREVREKLKANIVKNREEAKNCK